MDSVLNFVFSFPLFPLFPPTFIPALISVSLSRLVITPALLIALIAPIQSFQNIVIVIISVVIIIIVVIFIVVMMIMILLMMMTSMISVVFLVRWRRRAPL